MQVIDATGLILGRMATEVAKRALMGQKIAIINCEKALISGSRNNILEHYKTKVSRGDTFKGPFIHRMPDRFVRRTIRGMLSYKKEKGEKAFKRIMCYIGVPEELKDKEFQTIKNASNERLSSEKYMKVSELTKILGAREW